MLYLAGDLDPAAVLTELRGDGGGGDDAGLKRPAGRQRGQRPERGKRQARPTPTSSLGFNAPPPELRRRLKAPGGGPGPALSS